MGRGSGRGTPASSPSDGDVDGVRLLRPQTLAAMMTNHLIDYQRANSGWIGQKPFAVGRGFGLGVSIVLESSATDFQRRGNPGTVSWPGAYGAWSEADPAAHSVSILLAHNTAGTLTIASAYRILRSIMNEPLRCSFSEWRPACNSPLAPGRLSPNDSEGDNHCAHK